MVKTMSCNIVVQRYRRNTLRSRGLHYLRLIPLIAKIRSPSFKPAWCEGDPAKHFEIAILISKRAHKTKLEIKQNLSQDL